MIIQAHQDHIPQLMNIWKTVFQDEDCFIQGFFREIFPYVESYCWGKNGILAAMLYAIPCLVKDINGTLRQSYYFYALATLNEYRGQGIMKKLVFIGLLKVIFFQKKTAGLFSFRKK